MRKECLNLEEAIGDILPIRPYKMELMPVGREVDYKAYTTRPV